MAEAGAYYDAGGDINETKDDVDVKSPGDGPEYYIKELSASTITTPEMVWLTSKKAEAQEFKFVNPPSTINSKLKKKNYFSGGTDTSDSTTAKPTRFMFNKGGKDFYMGYSKGRAQDKKEAFHLEYFTLDMSEKGYMLDCVMNTNPAERYKGHGCTDNLKNIAPKWGPVRHTDFFPAQSYKSMKGNAMSELGDGDSDDSRGLRNRIRYMDSVSKPKPYVREIEGQTWGT